MKKNIIYFSLILVSLLSCHQEPQENINEKASIQHNDELLENPLLMTPITSSIHPKDSTMSTLYGNEIAVMHAKSNSKYPQGATLYEVTWKQKSDEWWFGANVPKEILSVEKVIFREKEKVEYEIYEGRPLKKKGQKEGSETSRILAIVSQKMAVSP